MKLRFANLVNLAGLLLLALYCTGCYTTKMVAQAKKDRQADIVHKVENTFIDSGKYLVINFTATLADKDKDQRYHIRVPVDTLMRLYQSSLSLFYYPDSTQQEKYQTDRIYRVLDQTDSLRKLGIGIEFKRPFLNTGFYNSSVQDSIAGNLVVYNKRKDFKYGETYSALHPILNARHIVFLYYPQQKPYNTPFKYDYIAISIEPSLKKRYVRYTLLPATVTADVVTFPFQMIGLGYFALLGKAMRF